jgi:hypothetical protein
MSAQSSSAIREPSPVDVAFDARWIAWIERGRLHDLAATRHLRIALTGAAVIAVLVVLFFNLA